VTHDPRLTPTPGDRWRDAWGTRTVRAIEAGVVLFQDGEQMPLDDFLYVTRRGGGWTYLEPGPSSPQRPIPSAE
jgi:hypothetical protein